MRAILLAAGALVVAVGWTRWSRQAERCDRVHWALEGVNEGRLTIAAHAFQALAANFGARPDREREQRWSREIAALSALLAQGPRAPQAGTLHPRLTRLDEQLGAAGETIPAEDLPADFENGQVLAGGLLLVNDLLRRGLPPPALHLSRALAKRYPDVALAHLLLSRCQQMQGQTQDAEQSLAEARRLAPQSSLIQGAGE